MFDRLITCLKGTMSAYEDSIRFIIFKAIHQSKSLLGANNMPLCHSSTSRQNNALPLSYPRFIKPEDLRTSLLAIIDKIEKFRFLGFPAAMGGRLTLRHGENSCFDALPMGPMRLWYSIVIKVAHGNTAALDWIEFYTAILSYYRMWLDVQVKKHATFLVLSPERLYEAMYDIKNNRLPSGSCLATHARSIITGSGVERLSSGAWAEDEMVIYRASQWEKQMNWCRCEKRRDKK